MRNLSSRVRSWPRSNREDRLMERQRRIRELSSWEHRFDFIFDWPVAAETLAGFQECLTAHMVLPVAAVGPLPVNMGVYEADDRGEMVERERQDDEIFVPLAHTEGGLSASLQRGITAASLAGGVRSHVLADRMTRDCCFVFRSVAEALTFSRWVQAHFPSMQEWLADVTNPLRRQRGDNPPVISYHAVLRDIATHIVGTACHVLYGYTTGDACGPNMVTRNSYALNQWFILERFPRDTGITPLRLFLETNMGGDKKPSHAYYQWGGHGKTVVAEITLAESVLRRVLHTSSDDLQALEHAGLHGTHASGMQSFAFTPASAIAAIFAATGQDLGMVGTSSMAHASLTRTPEGVHCALRLPTLEVATVGGGTGLPHAQAFLHMMGCAGPGKVYRFAQIVAAATLCLEVSASASMATSGSINFYRAHLERGGIHGG